MAKVKSWEVTDQFGQRVETLIPQRHAYRVRATAVRLVGGRKPKDPRLVFEAIAYVLRTGCQWKALPAERFGSASAIHARFLECEKAGVFENLWRLGLAEYNEMQGIAWRWQSIDGAMMKAPMAQESVGSNPTDRGKKWKQTSFVGRRTWRPGFASCWCDAKSLTAASSL